MSGPLFGRTIEQELRHCAGDVLVMFDYEEVAPIEQGEA
jgi:hypothetical protein